MGESKPAIYEWHEAQLRALEFPRAADGLEQLLLNLPEGTYEALRTRDHIRFFHLEQHLTRGVAGCRASGLPGFQKDDLRAGIDAAARHFNGDAKVRIDFLPRPQPDFDLRSTVLISFSPLKLPSEEIYRRGVGVYPTAELTRTSPIIKGTAFIAARTAYERPHEDDFEPILLDESGNCLEGAMSNFSCFEGDTLRTAGTGMLGGITRETLLRCATDLGFQVVEEAVHKDQVQQMDEAFLSSSVRGILPVVRFSGASIGQGKPGPRTLALSAAYEGLVKRTAKPALPAG